MERTTIIPLVLAVLVKMIFSIGPSFERLFDLVHLYWIATIIRKIKESFLEYEDREEQVKWVNEMNVLNTQQYFLVQRDIFLKELVIEYGTKGKLHEIADLDNCGPDNWQKKLQDQNLRMWINQNRRFAHFTRTPTGPVIRQYKMEADRFTKALYKNPARYLSRQDLLDACKARGGCCARKCNCCMRLRGLSANGEMVYSHCTVFCGCCVRRRGFIFRDSDHGAGVPGFVDHSKETFCIEDVSGAYPVS